MDQGIVSLILTGLGLLLVLLGALLGLVSTIVAWLIKLLMAQISAIKKEAGEDKEKERKVAKELFVEKEKMGNRLTATETDISWLKNSKKD